MSFIKQNFQFLIICILAFVIILERSCGDKTPTSKPTITVVRDTTWATPPAPIVNVYPTVTNKIPAAVVQQGHDTLFVPSINDSILRLQYKALRDSLLSQNIYDQTYKQDSSSVNVIDTVSQNKIVGRSYKFNLKYPIVTNTITIKQPYIPVAQVFFGGGFSGSQLQPIQDFHVGALLKTKKDQVYGIKAGLSPVGGLVVGADMYWKIKLRK